MSDSISLAKYRLLGRSGLRVSPLSLGTMTFGSEWGWGADPHEAKRIFDVYIEHGGNFVDTANQYTNGTAEELIGKFAGDRRDQLVIATKYTLPTRMEDPNSGGNHRKSMVNSVELSLRRLRTDYVDLLYLHAWDATTPAEDIMRAMDDLVRSGKVLYLGISNTMAWEVARSQAIAELRGWSRFVALQIEYNLIERTAERELIPMARALGLAVIPWSPLASGILSAKYTQADRKSPNAQSQSGSRKGLLVEHGVLTDHALAIAAAVREVGAEIDRPPAQIALAWLLQNPAIGSLLIGARTLEQLQQNIGALEIKLTKTQLERLDQVSSISLGFPHDYLSWLVGSSYMGNCMKFS